MQQRFSQTELDSIATVRNSYPSLSQRQLAADIWTGRVASVGLQSRSQASIYGAIRRFDRNNSAKSTATSTTRRRRSVFATA